ncbi:MAG TPA: A/G-specific adenine glycosylase [Wenzhouxiangella sp.]
MTETIPAFASRLLNWWQASGRHDLPWQQDRTPYRVWVSEIMLQQTQVSTVIDYFNRFMVRFPNLETLAHAETDEVLAHWSGLGYYARARNLHACAKRCMAEHAGTLPNDAATLETMPGIGRSTANAIVAQAHNQRAVILDGNVKRVLARHELIEGFTGQASVQNLLWIAADRLTPKESARDYTQAIMDLGAMICTRTKPQCSACPVHQDCQAFLLGRATELPTPRPKKAKKEMALHFFIYRNEQGKVLLQRRPNQGIWGGLWCLPHDSVGQQLTLSHPGSSIEPITHLLTHRRLLLTFEYWVVAATDLPDSGHLAWLGPQEALKLGLPKPIETVIAQLCSIHS